MKLQPSLVTSLAAVAVVGVGAFFVGRLSAPQAGQERGESAALPTKYARPGSTSGSGPGGEHAGAATGRGERAGTTSAFAKTDDPLARMKSILKGGNAIERTRSWLTFLDQLSADQFAGVVEAFRAGGVDPSKMSDYALLLTAWAKVDPLGALEYAKANTGSPFARQTILAAWAATDPDGAIRWAEANHDGEGANPWMVGVIRGLASTNPDLAVSLMQAMPKSPERGEALDAVLPGILDRGVQATRDWVSALQDPALRDGAMMRVADQLAETDPRGTSEWLVANPGDAANRRLDDTLSIWMGKDRDAALAFYQNLPTGDARTNALRGIVTTMATENPQAAADFIERHSADTNDRVYQQFAWHSFGQAPDLAVNYISRITNADERNGMYRRMIDSWLQRDEQAARNWLSGVQLPPDVVQSINRHWQERQQRQQ